MEIHIWDLLSMENAKITVDINESLKKEIENKIKENISNFSEQLSITPTRLYEYFIWKKSQIPLGILFSLSNLLGISNNTIEKNIISYKQLHVPSINSIKNPKLPIQVNPYFTSVLANLFFDGSVPKDGKGTYYNQKNEEIMGDFINKIKNIFGDVQYSLVKDHRSVLKCRLPRIVGEICRHIYNVESFGTFDARIPERIFSLERMHKTAFILTGIIDEGSVSYDGSIIFGVSNQKMIVDFEKLCNSIGLETGGVKQKKMVGQYYLYIKSHDKFLILLNLLKKEFPLINMRFKEERLKKFFEIRNQKYFNTKKFADNRKNFILNELKQNGQSINYLSSKFLMPPRTIRRYFYRLIEERKVKRKKVGNEFIYSLT